MKVNLVAVVDYSDLVSAVQQHLKPPVTQMYPPKMSSRDIENWFVALAENYGASNGVYISLYLDDSSFDDEDDKLIKEACREVLEINSRVLLHYSW